MTSSKRALPKISSTGQGEVEARHRQGLGRVEITQEPPVFAILVLLLVHKHAQIEHSS